MDQPSGNSSGLVPNIMLPPPSPSLSRSVSSSSVLGKRRRGCIDSSHDGSQSGFFARAQGSFTESTKDRIEAANGGDMCWCCGDDVIEFCHVIGRRSRRVHQPPHPPRPLTDIFQLFRELSRRRLLTINDLNGAANGIPLCPTCHTFFDAHDFPGRTFFPADLDYFLDFERQDFERRQKQFEVTGDWPTRVVPTAQDYLQHQANILPPEATGGLYRRMFLAGKAHVLGEDPKFPPKPWHGCPLAALSRAFHSLGSQSHLFPSDIRQQLRDLQDLYGTNDQRAGAVPNTQGLSIEAAALQGHPSTSDLNALFPYPSQSPRNVNDRLSGDIQGRTNAGQQTRDVSEIAQASATTINCRKRAASDDLDAGTPPCDERAAKRHLSNKHMAWAWGPMTSSEDKASFYQGIRSLRDKPKRRSGVLDSERIKRGEGKTLSVAAEEKPEVKQEMVQAVLPSPQPSAV
ncbi:MAG: hypothetical protein Q9202_001931 [Teloschistes flavicans]